MNDRLVYLERQIKHYKRLISITPIVMISFLVIGFYLGISYWYHSFINDSMTHMQLIKWSFGKYWYLYLYILVAYCYIKRMPHNIHILESFEDQYQRELKLKN